MYFIVCVCVYVHYICQCINVKRPYEKTHKCHVVIVVFHGCCYSLDLSVNHER